LNGSDAPHNRDWLNYQHEIGLRHTPVKKNVTDGARSPPVVQDEAELKRLEGAWTKAVLLHVTLWSRVSVDVDLW
jgi:hypothetical protein